jgi:hypothetical protein
LRRAAGEHSLAVLSSSSILRVHQDKNTASEGNYTHFAFDLEPLTICFNKLPTPAKLSLTYDMQERMGAFQITYLLFYKW